MDGKETDVQQTLTYSAARLDKQLLAFGLVALLVGLIGVHQSDSGNGMQAALAWLILAGGAGWSGYQFFKLFNPGKPMLELSPKGIVFRFVKEVFIPWDEVQGIDTIELKVLNPRNPFPVKFPNVTVILVSRPFYDKAIHIDQAYQRGMNWGNYFTSKGKMVQIAFPHAVMPVKPQELRQAIEARWRAFSEKGRAAPAQMVRWEPESTYTTLFGRVNPLDIIMIAAVLGLVGFILVSFLQRRQLPELSVQDAAKQRIDEQWKQFNEQMNRWSDSN